MKLFTETLYDAFGQSFRIDKVYFENRTEHQHLMIFHNAALGRVMVLDGVVQTTEKDEFVYHEMM
ncbi:MAG: polyamine aminopropyltransferase, partial [Gammaproteobacteria bacterium]